MNDSELDELLNTWRTPQPHESMRESVRAAAETHVAQRRRPQRPLLIRWKWAAAMAASVAVAVLILSSSAFSRRMSAPFIVDSEIHHFQLDSMEGVATPGSEVGRNFFPPAFTSLVTSYNEAGSEVILSASVPNRLKSLGGKIVLAFLGVAEGFKRRFMLSPDDEAAAFGVVYLSNLLYPMVVGRRDELLTSGCLTSHGGSKAVGREVILNYPVVGIQQPERGGTQMVTLWMAPELSCFALRVTIHAKQPDGAWKLMMEKQAMKVTRNQ